MSCTETKRKKKPNKYSLTANFNSIVLNEKKKWNKEELERLTQLKVNS